MLAILSPLLPLLILLVSLCLLISRLGQAPSVSIPNGSREGVGETLEKEKKKAKEGRGDPEKEKKKAKEDKVVAAPASRALPAGAPPGDFNVGPMQSFP